MSDIIRYDIETLDEYACDHYMGASQRGDYVLFADHEAALAASTARIAELEQQLAEAKVVVDKFPRTKDGVLIDPEMLLWSRVPRGEVFYPGGFKQTGWDVTDRPMPAKLMSLTGIMHNGYSTREAALAAKGGGDND